MFMTTVNKCHSLNNEILNANSSITINVLMSSCHDRDWSGHDLLVYVKLS